MTDPEALYTLAEAQRVLARFECERDIAGYLPYDPPGRPVEKLGHQLCKVVDGCSGELKWYRCERCDAKFAEMMTVDVVP